MSMDLHDLGANFKREIMADVRELLAKMLGNVSATVAVQDDGTVESDQHRILNFQGDGVTVTDEPTLRRTNIVIPGAPVASATTTVISTTGTVRVFPFGTAPANWETALFNDAAWAFGVTESQSISGFYTVVPTATWIVPTGFNGDNGASTVQWLARRSFTLPDGDVTSATLEINIDDQTGTTAGGPGDDLYINGHFLDGFQAAPRFATSPAGYATLSIPQAWLIPGTTNVMAVNCISGGGATALSFRITVIQAGAGADARYQLLSEKNAASGYAGLDSGVRVPTARLGSGSASGATFLRGDQTWAAASTNSIVVEELDASPSVAAVTLQFPNGTLTDHGGGVVEYNGGSSVATPVTNQLASDVTCTNANQDYDGPTVTVGAGTWLLIGVVQLYNVTGGNYHQWTARLWDGTTTYASGIMTQYDNSSVVQVTLCWVVSPGGSTTYKMSARCTTAGGTIRRRVENAPVGGLGNNASSLVAFPLAS